MEIEPDSIPKNLRHRLRIEDFSTGPEVLQLETRPRIPGSKCSPTEKPTSPNKPLLKKAVSEIVCLTIMTPLGTSHRHRFPTCGERSMGELLLFHWHPNLSEGPKEEQHPLPVATVSY